jgi:hypothetical protein
MVIILDPRKYEQKGSIMRLSVEGEKIIFVEGHRRIEKDIRDFRIVQGLPSPLMDVYYGDDDNTWVYLEPTTADAVLDLRDLGVKQIITTPVVLQNVGGGVCGKVCFRRVQKGTCPVTTVDGKNVLNTNELLFPGNRPVDLYFRSAS